MADVRIDRGVFSSQLEIETAQENLGILEELTSMPEWRGWDRIENSALSEASVVFATELNFDLAPVIEQLRTEGEYANLMDVDEKRVLLDILNNISTKLEPIVERSGSQRLANFQESLNDLLEMYQSAYYQQLASIKG